MGIARTFRRVLAGVLAALFVIIIGVLGLMLVLFKGPSPTATALFTRTVQETSAMKWLANMYLSQAEIDEIMLAPDDAAKASDLDTSLIVIAPDVVYSQAENEENPNKRDGIEIVEVSGSGFSGYMMIVDDPKRIFLGMPDNFGGTGDTLAQMVEKNDAVAGLNGGGFLDINGTGVGGTPLGLVVADGEVLWDDGEAESRVAGFDNNGILHVGSMTAQEALELDMQCAVAFGPTLIVNGVPQDAKVLRSGVNPRSGIGQRADGAALLLVIDGRQVTSLGATYLDMVDIFLDFDAVNAGNLDGGSSSILFYEGEIVNSCASISGPRPIPTAFLVSR